MTDDLDALFAQARARPPAAVPEALMARVLADAAAHLPATPPAFAPAPAAPPPGLWARVVAGLGGVGALAGMATAMVAGVWLGFAQPLGDGLAANLLGSGPTIDMMPGIDAFLVEEDLP